MHSSSLSLHEDFEATDRSLPNLGRKPSLHSTHSFFGYPRDQASIHRAFARPSSSSQGHALSSTTRSISSRSISARHFGSGRAGRAGKPPGSRVVRHRERQQLYRRRLGIGSKKQGSLSSSMSMNSTFSHYGGDGSGAGGAGSPSDTSSLLGLSGVRDFFGSFFSEGSGTGAGDIDADEDFESFVEDACLSWCSCCSTVDGQVRRGRRGRGCCCCCPPLDTGIFSEGPCFRGGGRDGDLNDTQMAMSSSGGDEDDSCEDEAEAEARARARFGRSKSSSRKSGGRSGRGGKSGRLQRRARGGGCGRIMSMCYRRVICGCFRTCCGVPCFLCFMLWLLRRFFRWFCGRCVAGMFWLLVLLVAFHAGTLLLLWVSLGMQGITTTTTTATGGASSAILSPETEVLRAAEFARVVVGLGDGTYGNWTDFEVFEGSLGVNWTWVDETVSQVDESGWLAQSVGELRNQSQSSSSVVILLDVLDLMLNLSGDVLQRQEDENANPHDPVLLLNDEHYRDAALIVSSLRLISACVRISISASVPLVANISEAELAILRAEIASLASFRSLLFPPGTPGGWFDFECEEEEDGGDVSMSMSSLLSNDILALVSHVNQSDGKRISVWVFASFLVVLAIGTAISGGCLVSNCVKTERNETREALVETVYLVADTADCLLTLSYDAKPIVALFEKPRAERTFVERYLVEVVRWQQELSRYVPQSAILHQPTGAEMRGLECDSSDDAEMMDGSEDVPWMKGMGLRRRGSMVAKTKSKSSSKNKLRSVDTVDTPRSGSDSLDRLTHRGGFLNAAMRRSKKRKETLAALRARMTGGFKRVEVTILVIEIQDFDRLSKAKDCRRLLDAHSVWLSEMTRIIRSFGGATTHVNGNRLLCTFNAEVPCPSHQIKACKAALACVREMNHVRSKYQCEQVGLMDINIGIVSNKVICGVTGSTTRKNFVLMGKTDEAFALCKLNGAYGTQILVDSHVFTAARYPFLFRTIDIIRYCRNYGSKRMGWRGVRKIFQLVKLKSIQRREWMYELQDLEEQDPLRDYNHAWDCFISNQLDPAVGKMVTFLEANRNDKHASRSLAIFRQIAAAPKITASERSGERPEYDRQESISSQLTVCRYCRRVSIDVGYVIDSLTQLLDDGAPLDD